MYTYTYIQVYMYVETYTHTCALIEFVSAGIIQKKTECLVSLFNGISAFMGYLMQKPFL